MMSPVILAGAEEPHRKFSDVMLHGYDVIRHVAMMTDFTRPPSTSRHVHRRSFVTTSQHETRCEDDRFHTATIYKQTRAQTFVCHKHHNMKHATRKWCFSFLSQDMKQPDVELWISLLSTSTRQLKNHLLDCGRQQFMIDFSDTHKFIAPRLGDILIISGMTFFGILRTPLS